MKIYEDRDFFPKPSYPFFIDKYTIRKGEVIPMHSHSFYELVFVVEGHAWHECRGETRELQEGDVFIVDPQTAHRYRGREDEVTVVYNVMFQLSLLDRELSRLSEIDGFVDFFYLAPFLHRSPHRSPYLNVNGRARATLEGKLQTISCEDERKVPGYELMVRSQLIEFFVCLSRYMLEHKKEPARKQVEETEWLSWVTALLREIYNQPISLNQFSRMCAMSPSAFAQKFKQRTGKSFLQFKRELQIAEACRLLRGTDRSIVQVAGETGYDDLSHFYRIFRRQAGCTPLQYRNHQEACPTAAR
ncbi:AraC family transcriptional regulator [Paenibacillus sp. CF384]|uniref:AraC family transcriptional regulator n=1 Tax=Paenibacillus sp. CF384 TaxID=1884382 RepID=UPI00089BADF4|nr:AraC family transcriptional regulator [Paenibacillus sp. CF384]SDW90913.1 AraC-type DNA-binding protein [Paenibacillus sp. CF384]